MWFVAGVVPTALSLVPRGLSSVKVFPPFDSPRTLPVTSVIFSEESGSSYGYIIVVTFETECRECDQIIIGRNFAYRRALEVIQNEEYVDFIDIDILRKKKRSRSEKHQKICPIVGKQQKV